MFLAPNLNLEEMDSAQENNRKRYLTNIFAAARSNKLWVRNNGNWAFTNPYLKIFKSTLYGLETDTVPNVLRVQDTNIGIQRGAALLVTIEQYKLGQNYNKNLWQSMLLDVKFAQIWTVSLSKYETID